MHIHESRPQPQTSMPSHSLMPSYSLSNPIASTDPVACGDPVPASGASYWVSLHHDVCLQVRGKVAKARTRTTCQQCPHQGIHATDVRSKGTTSTIAPLWMIHGTSDPHYSDPHYSDPHCFHPHYSHPHYSLIPSRQEVHDNEHTTLSTR